MKTKKLSNGVIAEYTSLSQLSTANNMRTSNVEKLETQRENFLKRNGVCPVCKNPWRFIKGTNLLICSSDKCPGINKKKKEVKEGEVVVIEYIPSVIYLNSISAEIANTIFD